MLPILILHNKQMLHIFVRFGIIFAESQMHDVEISGILFNIRWNYDWHTDTTSCYYVQDYKRSSSWNIEHGYVETYTINQMSIASRSFRVVYQCYFQIFSTYSQSVRAKKKKKEERKQETIKENERKKLVPP